MARAKGGRIGRREFMGVTAGVAGATILKPRTAFGSAANSALRLGLLGCGGRGTSVMSSFLEHTSAVLAAAGDLFPDQLEAGRQKLDEVSAKFGKPPLARGRLFHGLSAYEALFASADVDAVYVATPPFFHPAHLEAAIAAGKHVYLEKPVAIDVPGAKKVTELGERAREKKLSLAVGFQIRHASPYVELARRVHEGQVGTLASGEIHYFAARLKRPDWPDATPLERRVRNWVHDKALSGDIIVEQNIHIIDVTNWMLGAHPISAVGSAGRGGRSDAGDCSGHFNCVFSYPGGVHVSFASTQFGPGPYNVGMQYYGTRGSAEARYDAPVRVVGDSPWEFPGLKKPEATDSQAAATGAFRGALDDADPNKQRSFVDSITSGKLLSEAETGALSALSSMLGREAAYSGKELAWEKLLESKERNAPGIDWKAFA
jgi:myo-inositol 2-dehydrogenase / D-chiro-inositol 1-dehydrogenase